MAVTPEKELPRHRGPHRVHRVPDLDAVEDGTRIRLRWKYAGEGSADAGSVERVRIEKEAAFSRLGGIVTRA